MTVRESIDTFLGQKRLAMVGVSRDPKNFSRTLYNEFVRRGYDMVPVNPKAADIEGKKCYGAVSEITPPVDGVIIMTPPDLTPQVVQDCDKAGVRRVWMHRGEGLGAVNPEAVEYCQSHGMDVVPGFCPFMFFEGTPFFHRVHGFIMKLGNKYPN